MLFDSSAVSQPATKLPREGLPQDAEVHCCSLNPHQHFQSSLYLYFIPLFSALPLTVGSFYLYLPRFMFESLSFAHVVACKTI